MSLLQIILTRGGIILKKYMALFSFTLILITGVMFIGKFIKPKVLDVETICIVPQVGEEFITCSGKIEYSEGEKIFVKSPSIVSNLFVKVGDKVSKGDILANVCPVKNPDILPPTGSMKEIENNSDLKEVYSNFVKNKHTDNKINENKPTLTNSESEEILAPINGIVSSINAENNSLASGSLPVLAISKDESFKIKLSINEAKVSEIKIGQKVIITGVGFKDKTYMGHIEKISNEAKQTINLTGTETTVDVIVNIDSKNEDNNIKPGFTAKCKIITNQAKDIPILPYKSVKQDDKGGEYVYKYNKGLAEKIYVKTGKEYDEGFEVLSGISLGEVIIDNPDLVFDKAWIKRARKEGSQGAR